MEISVKLTVLLNILLLCVIEMVLTVWDPNGHSANDKNMIQCKPNLFHTQPFNVFKSNGKCYYGWKRKMIYDDAKTLCESGNTHIVFLETEDEVQGLCQVIPKRYGRVWLGMTKQLTRNDYNYKWLWRGNGLSESISDYRWDEESEEEDDWEDNDRVVTSNICGADTWITTRSYNKYRVICEEEVYSSTAHPSTVHQSGSSYTSSFVTSTQHQDFNETGRNMTSYTHQQSQKDDIIIAVVFIVVFFVLLILIAVLFLWNKFRKNPSVFENNLNTNSRNGDRVQRSAEATITPCDRHVAPTVAQCDNYDRLQTKSRAESNLYRQLPQLPPTIPEYLHLVGETKKEDIRKPRGLSNSNFTGDSSKRSSSSIQMKHLSPRSQNDDISVSMSAPRTSSMNPISTSDVKISGTCARQRMPSFDTSDDYLPQYQNDSTNPDFDTMNTTGVSSTDYLSDYDSADSYYKSPTRPVSCSIHANYPDENVYDYIEEVEVERQNNVRKPSNN